ncbi:MAG: FG-GAP-like repeat-containing protein [Archangium sp.]
MALSACEPAKVTPLELTSIAPTQGTARGGQRLTVKGAGFDTSSTVIVGGRPARVTKQTDDELTVVTPSGIAGVASIEVTAGEAKQRFDGGYTYERLPFLLVDATEVKLEAGPVEGALTAVADYEGDGDDDLFQAARREGVAVLVNDAEKLTQRIIDVPGTLLDGGVDGGTLVRSDIYSVAAGDFDSDGTVDLFLGTAGKTRSLLLFGNEGGGFSETASKFPTVYGSNQRATVLDSDGDGDLDLIVTASALNEADAPVVMLFTNDGRGKFVDASSKLAGPKLAATGVSAADFDGDGDNDLFFSMTNETCRLFLGDGSGVFQLAAPDALPVDSSPKAGVAAVGDLDHDGTLDLYVPTETQDQVWLNDGTAHFANLTEAHLSPEVQPADSAQFVDLDLDGHLDVVVVERAGRMRFLRNDGMGRLFDYSPDIVGNDNATRTVDALVVDLEKDGVPELFASRAGVARPAFFVTTLDTEDADEDGWFDSLDVCVEAPASVQSHRAPFGCRSSAECQAKLGCDLKVFGDSAYLSCAAPVTFDAAKAFCEKQGALLAEIDSAQENVALASGLAAASWFALDDRESEGMWKANGATVGWFNWGSMQPDNAGAAGEDCGSVAPDGKWNDLPCTATARTLCETSRFPTPVGSDTCPSDAGVAMNADGGVGDGGVR